MKTIAVTGANGYLGSRLIPFLFRKNQRVVALGRSPCPAASASAFVDIAGVPEHNAYDALNEADVLIHCAYDYRPYTYEDVARANVEGTARLFAEARTRGVKQIVYISSVSAFEGAVSMYGRAKLAAESEAAKVGAIILRPGVLFSKNAGGIVGALSMVAGMLPVVPLIGKGDQPFYPCHVNDLCEALYTLINIADVPIGVPIVTACETPITFRGMIELFARAKDKKPLLVPVPYLLLYAALRTLETFGLRLSFRSDGLVYIKHPAPSFDFIHTCSLGLTFRPMTLETLSI